ncbi:MAG TPA: hypothetical protein VGN74_11830 [Brevundimonas sp.]|jgi:hypothetical protein|uniref:hypothetical protein n=1 Tax=Brevundimonas sp. TaxID=1871086 RepID=UPI002E167F1E|nr:hypothetical protein [Brevundimonas sp.]
MPAFRTPAAAAVVLSGLLGLAACDRPTEAPPEPVPATPVEAPAPPVVQIAPMTRADLIAAFDAAASAFAEGRAAPPTPRVAGRQFNLVQAFGCTAPAAAAPPPGLAGTSRTAGDAVSLSLTPADWAQTGLIRQAAPEAEAVEGLWLTRPWLRTPACPATPFDPLMPAGVSPQVYGLAVIFPEGGSRVNRRDGRAYSHVVRSQADGAPTPAPAGGYRLVVSGRLTSFADGRAIRCAASGPDQRPTCIAAVEIDRVAFTDAAGATLSEWRN